MRGTPIEKGQRRVARGPAVRHRAVRYALETTTQPPLRSAARKAAGVARWVTHNKPILSPTMHKKSSGVCVDLRFYSTGGRGAGAEAGRVYSREAGREGREAQSGAARARRDHAGFSCTSPSCRARASTPTSSARDEVRPWHEAWSALPCAAMARRDGKRGGTKSV